MIHVRREQVPPPEGWLEKAARETKAAAGFYGHPDAKAKTFAFSAYKAREVRERLEALFQSKCAFCESRLGAGDDLEIEHFRPKARAIGLDGTVLEPGYWWLAAEWSNLYLACLRCSRNKANRFPVVGPRAQPLALGKELRREAALLIDPCVDDPADYLVFRDDGLVASLPHDREARGKLRLGRFRGQDRGQVTIDVFGLNRVPLVQARQLVAVELRQSFAIAQTLMRALEARPDDEKIATELSEVLRRVLSLRPDEDYLALRRQLAAEYRRQLDELVEVPADVEVPAVEAPVVEEHQKQQAFEQLERHEIRVKQSSIEDQEDKLIFHHSATIAAVEIENFRNIERLEFEFPEGTADRAGWKVLLGENGVGKSSVLQAVALTLMGAKRAGALRDVDKRRLVRDGSRADGRVRVYLSAEADPLEMYVTRDGISFPRVGSTLRTFVVGFGAARWLPRRGALRPDADPSIRIRNLFNPFVPLQDAPSWLLTLDQGQFRRAARAVLRLLDRPEGDRLRRLEGNVRVHPEGERLSKAILLNELSDGYQAMLAIAGEISEITSTRWHNLADAEGVVLIDEIGAHLHPRWKMRVVKSLRSAFPRMQVLASTHDPLCLRGLGAGEILVLRRDDDELVVLDDLPGTDELRVDQLLTSHLFGLGSTLDPETEHRFTEYYALLAKRELEGPEEARLEELTQTVGARGILGATRRDQAIYQIIDEYLAAQEGPTDDAWSTVSDATKHRVLEVLTAGAPDSVE